MRTQYLLVGALIAVVLVIGRSSADDQPPTPREKREKVFGTLLDQPPFAAALDTKVPGNSEVGQVLDELLKRAYDTDRFRAGWVTEYRAKQGAFPGRPAPDPNVVSGFKGDQRALFLLILETIQKADEAANVLAAKSDWPAWLVLARGFNRLTSSIPEFGDLLGIEQGEAEKLKELRLVVHKAAKARQTEWNKYLESDTALPNTARQQFDADRKGLVDAIVKLKGLEAKLARGWGEHLRNGEFGKQWQEFLTGQGSVTVDNIVVRHTSTWARQDDRAGNIGPATNRQRPEFKVNRVGLVAWPFVLAEKLKLGKVTLGYDSLGFTADEGLSTLSPVLTPLIRVRGVFKPADGTAPITAVDLRLLARPTDRIPVRTLRMVPPTVRRVTQAPADPDGRLRAALDKAAGFPLPSTPPIDPRAPLNPAVVTAVIEKNVQDWLAELSTHLQDNVAVDLLIGDRYWSNGDGLETKKRRQPDLERLELRWRKAVLGDDRATVSAANWLGLAPRLTADELASVAGDHAAVRDLILRAAQTDAKTALERLLVDLTADANTDFQTCRAGFAAATDLVRGKRGDLKAASAPELVLFASAQTRFDDWSRHVAGMLPAPTVPIHQHPWPDRFGPEVAPNPAAVWSAADRLQFELDQLQFAEMAAGNPAFGKLLTDLRTALSPANTDFRRDHFAATDARQMQYAEVDRLLLLATNDKIGEWVGQIPNVGEDAPQDEDGIMLLFRGMKKAGLTGTAVGTTVKDKDYRDLWRAAGRGVPHARYLLGTCYENGVGMVKDPAAAVAEYEAAAARNHPLAISRLIACYRNGIGTRPNSAKAAAWEKTLESFGYSAVLW